MISILIDYKLDKYSREIKFAFDFIFETLGFSHRFITDNSHLRQHDILLLYGLIEPTIEELKQLTRQYITLFIPAEPRLYEPKAILPDQLRRLLREIKIFTPTPVVSEKKFDYPAENYTELDIYGCKINFDLPGNIFYHLANLEEAADPTRDHDGCFPETASAFYQWRDIPFIDNFLWLLDNLLKEQARAKDQYLVQKHYWPKAQDMAVALTHSVDELQKWDFNSLFFSVLDDLSLLLTFRWKTLFRNIWSKLKYIFTNYEMYWNFQEYQSLEKELHLRSTWFIAAERTREIDYSLDDLDLQDEIKLILRQGNEIGLLTTDDNLNRDAWAARRQIMLRQLQKDVLGIRQRDFCLNEKTRDLHEKMEVSYDSGPAFKETAGFRHGLIFPYFPWQVYLKSNHPEMPVCFRDSCLKTGKYSQIGLEDAKQLFKKVFQAVRRRKGLLSLDFTLANYADISYCSKLYAYLLALIKAEKAYVATLTELSDWWNLRNLVTIEESEFDFSLSFPVGVESFAIQYFGKMAILQVEGADAKIEGKTISFSNLKPDTVAVVRLGRNESESSLRQNVIA